jgi:hypothetical protein
VVAGQVAVFSTGSVKTSWTSVVGNSATLLTASMTIPVGMGPADLPGEGGQAELAGTGPFAGSAEGWGLP